MNKIDLFRGTAKRTASGESCVDWESPQLGFWFDQDQIRNLGPLENNTFCRNPDDAAEPWCLIEVYHIYAMYCVC